MPTHQGSTWSSPAGTNGLGADKASVNVGEFDLGRQYNAFEQTLTLGLRQMGLPSGVANGNIIARVTVGTGAAGFQFLIDFNQGTSITIPGGRVTVDAIQRGTVAFGVALSAAVSVGTKGSTGFATFTDFVSLAAGVVSVGISNQPPRATRVMVPRVFTTGATPVPAAPPPPPYFPTALPSNLIIDYTAAGFTNVLGEWRHNDPADSAVWTNGVVVPGVMGILTLTATPGLGADKLQPVVWILDS